MDNNQDKEVFSYTYSAKEQEEVKRIKSKYLPPEEDKMEQLRRLDRSVARKGTVYALIIGIIGTLIMGIGMCCTMVWEKMVLGIVIGIIGIITAALAYPVYNRVTKREREKIAPEIMRLADELMK
ncbi:MAG: hypothetical protein IJZ89_09425 [Clostridia bacterium]|nr:hypothetical protein [Clostridia bacterium]